MVVKKLEERLGSIKEFEKKLNSIMKKLECLLKHRGFRHDVGLTIHENGLLVLDYDFVNCNHVSNELEDRSRFEVGHVKIENGFRVGRDD